MSGLDLYQTQRALALMLVSGAVAGFGLGMVYGLLRFLRILLARETAGEEKGSKRPVMAVLLFLEDVVFSVITAVTLILLLYYTNDGQLRAPAVMGMACGFFVYSQTLGRLAVRLEKALSRLIKKAIRALLLLLAAPLRLAGGLTARAGRLVWSLTVGKALRKRREKQTSYAAQVLKTSAKRGFDLLDSPDDTPKKK